MARARRRNTETGPTNVTADVATRRCYRARDRTACLWPTSYPGSCRPASHQRHGNAGMRSLDPGRVATAAGSAPYDAQSIDSMIAHQRGRSAAAAEGEPAAVRQGRPTTLFRSRSRTARPVVTGVAERLWFATHAAASRGRRGNRSRTTQAVGEITCAPGAVLPRRDQRPGRYHSGRARGYEHPVLPTAVDR